MSILSDRGIIEALKNKELSIEPFKDENLTPNGYDLSIDEIYISKTNEHIKKGKVVIPGMTWFVISTKEFVKIGSKLTCQLWIRSSYARRGVIASFGKVDAGFHGTLTISCFNANSEEITLQVGSRFCQIVFENLDSSPLELYDKKSGNYQNQKGIKLR